MTDGTDEVISDVVNVVPTSAHARREARKRKILESKDDRMGKVLGEYNKHRTFDKEDNDDISQFLTQAEDNTQITIEPADKGARVVVFSVLGLLILLFERANSSVVSLFWSYLCAELAMLAYMVTKGFLYRKMRPAPVWSSVFMLFGMQHEQCIRLTKYIVFFYNLGLDYLAVVFSYSFCFYWITPRIPEE